MQLEHVKWKMQALECFMYSKVLTHLLKVKKVTRSLEMEMDLITRWCTHVLQVVSKDLEV